MPTRHLEHHEMFRCPDRLVACVFQKYGCPKKIKAAQHFAHLEEFERRHVFMKFNHLEQRFGELAKKMRACQLKLKELSGNWHCDVDHEHNSDEHNFESAIFFRIIYKPPPPPLVEVSPCTESPSRYLPFNVSMPSYYDVRERTFSLSNTIITEGDWLDCIVQSFRCRPLDFLTSQVRALAQTSACANNHLRSMSACSCKMLHTSA